MEQSPFEVSIDDHGIALVVFDLPNEKVNVLSIPTLEAFGEVLDELAATKEVRGLILRSGKDDSFIAGADLKAFEPVFRDPSRAEQMIAVGHRVFDQLAALPFPTVALINGVCVGGGTELALACTYRVVTDHSKTEIGLPETQLGIMPGWGGTQRLPRLIGLEQGIKLIVTGKKVPAKKALKLGLADKIVAYPFALDQSREFLEKTLTGHGRRKVMKKRRRCGLRTWLLECNPLGRKLLYHTFRKNIRKKAGKHYPAPLCALETIEQSYTLPLESGLQKEKELFLHHTQDAFVNAPHLIQLFFTREKVKRDSGVEGEIAPRSLHSTAVIGAGTMGAGIIFLFSKKGYSVRFKEISWEAVSQGFKRVAKLYYKIMVKKLRKMTKREADVKFSHVGGGISFDGFQSVDFVLEAAVEEMEIKKKLLQELEQNVAEDAIIATNTSSLPLEELSSVLKRPERFVGVHFFNPAERMPLVEVAAGPHTKPEVVATAVAFCKKLGKDPIVVGDCPGFLVNRVYMRGFVEAVRMLKEGVSMEHIEETMTDFGMPMGPFTLADHIGNDISVHVADTFEQAYGQRQKMPSILAEMVEAGFTGKKAGKGFFVYSGRSKSTNAKVNKMLKKPKMDHQPSSTAIRDRIILPMMDEAARCLDEGIVQDPDYVDLALILGTGFPPFKGGLLRFADDLGIDYIVEHLKEFQQQHGDRFSPCTYLLQMQSEKTSFHRD